VRGDTHARGSQPYLQRHLTTGTLTRCRPTPSASANFMRLPRTACGHHQHLVEFTGKVLFTVIGCNLCPTRPRVGVAPARGREVARWDARSSARWQFSSRQLVRPCAAALRAVAEVQRAIGEAVRPAPLQADFERALGSLRACASDFPKTCSCTSDTRTRSSRRTKAI